VSDWNTKLHHIESHRFYLDHFNPKKFITKRGIFSGPIKICYEGRLYNYTGCSAPDCYKSVGSMFIRQLEVNEFRMQSFTLVLANYIRHNSLTDVPNKTMVA